MNAPDDSSSAQTNTHAPPPQGGGGNKQLAIQRIYVKDLSFESPLTPQVFAEDWQPHVDVNLGSESRGVGPELFEVELVVTVSVKVGESTAFLVEVHQAGVFQLTGFTDKELGPMLGSYCPNILFPFAREVVSDLVSKGGFPQFLLAPVNFDALYSHHLQTRQAEGASAGPQQGSSEAEKIGQSPVRA